MPTTFFKGPEDSLIIGNIYGRRASPRIEDESDFDGNDTTLATQQGGQVIINNRGDFVYTPPENFAGQDSFSYIKNTNGRGNNRGNGNGANREIEAKIDIDPVNDAPVAQNDTFTGLEDEILTGNLLVDNGHGPDNDPDAGEILNVQAGTYETLNNGTVEIKENGDFIYIPVQDFYGQDSFSYTLIDSASASDTGEVFLTLADVTDVVRGNGGENDIAGSAGQDLVYGGTGDDTLTTGAGDDEIRGQGGTDTLYGGDGADRLYGGGDGDLLYGDAGDDRLYGDGGDDILQGGQGDDLLNGGLGIDTADYSTSTAGIVAHLSGSGDDGMGGVDTLERISNLTGSDYSDTVTGDTGDNVINGRAGDDVLKGNLGDDVLTGGAGADVISGALGADTLDGGTGNDVMLGGSGDDLLYAGTGNDVINGGSGIDSVNFAASQTGIIVNLRTSLAQDGEDGTDTLIMVENITGSGFNDQILGDERANTIRGMDGADNLSGHFGDDILYGGNGDDALAGAADNDVLYGEDGLDKLLGGGGNDSLYGGADQDTLKGSAGDDFLSGGAGLDFLAGGTGGDTFAFENYGAGRHFDYLYDFNVAEGDRLDFSNLVDGYDPLTDAISDFVKMAEAGNNTFVRVDKDGSAQGSGFALTARLFNTTGLDPQDMLDNGNLVMS